MSENNSATVPGPELEPKVLVYVGPSLDREQVLEKIPEAIIRPPARQSDIVSDLLEYEPTHILLIDGEFHANLSVWHKEIVYTLQIPGVQGVYGSSSMGALRAADLSEFGMVGCGQIFRWYDEGVITDESEVSVLYFQRPDSSYVCSTIPLVNVRATLLAALEADAVTPEQADKIFNYAASIHWTERTPATMQRLGNNFMDWLGSHDQKKADALELVCTFQSLKPRPAFRPPQPDDLSLLFKAQFERDRLVNIKETPIALQYIDQFVTLHDIDYAQKLWDANNRACALLLADMYRVTISQTEFDTEWGRFCARHNLSTVEVHQQWLRDNNINLREFCRLMLESGRLRKLHRALSTRSLHRRGTQRLLDYLRTADSYTYWANEAAECEKKINESGALETMTIDLSVSPHKLMLEHLERSGQSVDGDLETYARESGFNSLAELSVALERNRLGETDG